MGVGEYLLLTRAASVHPLSLFHWLEWYPFVACGIAFNLEWMHWDSLGHYDRKTNTAGSVTLQTMCWLFIFAQVLVFVLLLAVVLAH